MTNTQRIAATLAKNTARDGSSVVASGYNARGTDEHTLTVFNAVDVPDAIARKVMNLLNSYDPDCYTRACDETGKAID